MSMAEPGTFWNLFVISLIDRTTNCWASWNSMLAVELSKIAIIRSVRVGGGK